MQWRRDAMNARSIAAILVLVSIQPALAQDGIQTTENVRVSDAELQAIPKESILRIEGDAEQLAPNWSGVRSCSDINRARESAEIGANAWVKQKLAEHPGKKHLRDGWGPAKWHYVNRRRHSGARHCTGGIDVLPVWVELKM
jgi:hypothetical protein